MSVTDVYHLVEKEDDGMTLCGIVAPGFVQVLGDRLQGGSRMGHACRNCMKRARRLGFYKII